MTTLEAFLRDYGLWALFFAAAVEGDLTLLLSGMLVHLGIWPATPAVIVGGTGALVGDTFYFWLGHGAARRWLTTAHGQRVLPRIERATQRYGVWSLVFARYIYGTRVVTMFLWGVRRLPYYKFLLIEAPNCFLWAALFGGLGYLFSNSLQALVGEVRQVELWLLVGLVVFALLLGLRHYLAEFGRIQEQATRDGNEP